MTTRRMNTAAWTATTPIATNVTVSCAITTSVRKSFDHATLALAEVHVRST
jgi:hypothetical protein